MRFRNRFVQNQLKSIVEKLMNSVLIQKVSWNGDPARPPSTTSPTLTSPHILIAYNRNAVSKLIVWNCNFRILFVLKPLQLLCWVGELLTDGGRVETSNANFAWKVYKKQTYLYECMLWYTAHNEGAVGQEKKFLMNCCHPLVCHWERLKIKPCV